jgi:hypothetical protein
MFSENSTKNELRVEPTDESQRDEKSLLECENTHYNDSRLDAIISLQFINGPNQLPSSRRNESRLRYDDESLTSKSSIDKESTRMSRTLKHSARLNPPVIA